MLAMSHTLPLTIVLLVGLYLVTLAAMALLAPARATRFLMGFAGTARTHYLELALRGIAGGAFVLQAPEMRFGGAFALFGWTLLLTAAGLAVVPWRWHRAFARRAVPHAVRRLGLVAVGSLVLGGLVLSAALRGRSA
jgi:hypothetical protein